tara:strand:+ start:955 stop:2112 length:1158 start_codon:yes stop_codon:yes gene_type:complete
MNNSLILKEQVKKYNAWIELDLGALSRNIATIKDLLSEDSSIIAVVKANAYGHGIKLLGPTLEKSGIERFAVYTITEGIELRSIGLKKPILVMGPIDPLFAELAIKHDLTITCNSLELGNALALAAKSSNKTATIHFKIDTGLHRFGNTFEEIISLEKNFRNNENIVIEGIYTHLANGDLSDDSFTDLQMAKFREIVRALPDIKFLHVANSATMLRRSELHYQGVRCGLILYGETPGNIKGPELESVLSLKARIMRVSNIDVGDGVGYGLRWKADVPSRLGLIPIGYADGWLRSFTNQGIVLAGGVRCQIVGTVNMDSFVIDLTKSKAKLGDEVVLLGQQQGKRISANEATSKIQTIPYELLTGLGARLPRLSHRSGTIIGLLEP